MTAGTADSFPRRSARTRGFTLGRPRGFVVDPAGTRVVFLRSPAGDDPLLRLVVLDLASGAERVVADPGLLHGDDADLPAAERARRERSRERAGGIVAFSVDDAVSVAAFALGGRLFAASLAGLEYGARPRELPVAGPVVDPRLDRAGARVAYVTDGALHVVGTTPSLGAGHRVVGDDDPDVTWGLADFVAAEEMGRTRGFWWGPDGERLAVARVDNRPVPRWHIADPADPAKPPVVLRYPAAGTANAAVGLAVAGLDGSRVEVTWDAGRYPYLARVSWGVSSPLTLAVQTRDQREVAVLTADPGTGETTVAATDTDGAWVELVPGSPAWLSGGRLVTAADRDGARRVLVDGRPVTPDGLQVRRIVSTGGGRIVVAASEEPTEVHLWRIDPDGAEAPERLTSGAGVWDGVAGGGALVVSGGGPDGAQGTRVLHPDRPPVPVAWHTADPGLVTRPVLLRAGPRELRTALLLPGDPALRERPLPVLLDPYGGPHAQRVLATAPAFWNSQWFADQGFAVIVADGRGTPGRGPQWERAVHRDLATAVLEDQVDALGAVAKSGEAELDLDKVAIRGWSFGGYLAALAVLRRPDVFAAAVAGAPVTDWRLYDTHYTERYLGHPDADPDAYERSSLLADAERLERPLLLVHGLADDNVVAAHTLKLSGALLAAGRPHSVLPLSGVTHMTPQEVVAENLLLLQLDFLRRALGLDAGKDAGIDAGKDAG
jgi:dipeptidyl-peptidase-4